MAEVVLSRRATTWLHAIFCHHASRTIREILSSRFLSQRDILNKVLARRKVDVIVRCSEDICMSCASARYSSPGISYCQHSISISQRVDKVDVESSKVFSCQFPYLRRSTDQGADVGSTIPREVFREDFRIAILMPRSITR